MTPQERALKNYWMNMITVEKRDFFAKILLFGEYSIIYGGQAFIIPLRLFAGSFDYYSETSINRSFASKSNQALWGYLEYLKRVNASKEIFFPLDLEALEESIARGLYFKSTIPQGYGAGSSGALVAAIFYHFSSYSLNLDKRRTKQPLDDVRHQLALMESFFHGNSSGLDPLCSLLAKSFVVDSHKNILLKKTPPSHNDHIQSAFLIDTLTTGKTKPLVDGFKQEISQKRININLLRDLSDETLKAFLDRDSWLFWNYLTQLSLYQYENMKPMIPENIRGVWERGLQDQSYIIKLCGSGGGGFVLGFTEHMEETRKTLSLKGFHPIVL